eukprot:4562779-Amphidinium_carterae.2
MQLCSQARCKKALTQLRITTWMYTVSKTHAHSLHHKPQQIPNAPGLRLPTTSHHADCVATE